jgi:hypothetical protein
MNAANTNMLHQKQKKATKTIHQTINGKGTVDNGDDDMMMT